MKQIILILLLVGYTGNLFSQTEIKKTGKLVHVWVHTKEGSMRKGILIGGTTNTLMIYPGTMKQYKNRDSIGAVSMWYESITIIKTKKKGGLLKGLLIGAGIGFFPVVFGQGGAYVAVFTFPLGIIAGTIIGLTSKKKYMINGNSEAFQKFIAKFTN